MRNPALLGGLNLHRRPICQTIRTSVHKSPPQGDERTPDKTQGQIKYAPGQTKKSEGGAGEPKVSDLEPEKQRGIGGP